jgi:predicted neuraminidase
MKLFISWLAGLSAALMLATGAARAGDPVLRSEFIDDQPPYPQCHASTIAETPSHRLVAAWFGGTHEGDPGVTIWVARQDHGQWQKPVSVADGAGAGGTPYPTWNPVLFQAPGGDLLLFYKVGPNPAGWWGMVMTSRDEGRTWSAPRRLPDGILGPVKNKPVVLADGSWLAGASVETNPGGVPHWRVHFEISRDRGQSWIRTEDVASPAGIDAIQPSILFQSDGRLEAVMRTRQGALAATWSRDQGRTWSALSAIDLPNPNSGTDAVTLKDGRQLIVYNHSAHSPDSPGKGPRWPLNVALSDDGVTWRPVLTLEDKPLPDGYAYPAVIQTADGLVHITYTWDRKRIRHVILDPQRLK